jgi:hypothetical protein
VFATVKAHADTKGGTNIMITMTQSKTAASGFAIRSACFAGVVA